MFSDSGREGGLVCISFVSTRSKSGHNVSLGDRHAENRAHAGVPESEREGESWEKWSRG